MTAETSNARGERVLVPRELLEEARNIAMEWTLKGRVPECGKFGQIAQDLDAMLAAAPQPPSAPVGVEDVVMAARNAENAIRNCAAAGQIGEGYVQYADDLRDAVQRLAQQPAAVDGAMVERIAALLHEEATGEPWAVAGVAHPGPDRDYYRGLARKVAALAAQHQEPTT